MRRRANSTSLKSAAALVINERATYRDAAAKFSMSFGALYRAVAAVDAGIEVSVTERRTLLTRVEVDELVEMTFIRNLGIYSAARQTSRARFAAQLLISCLNSALSLCRATISFGGALPTRLKKQHSSRRRLAALFPEKASRAQASLCSRS